MKVLYAFPSDKIWQYRLRYSYDEALKDALKAYPGINWIVVDGRKEWVCPREALPWVETTARELNHKLKVYPHEKEVPRVTGDCHPGFWNFQRAASKALDDCPDNGYILNFEMGLGKTPVLIDALRRRQIERSLIVAPAMVRKTWIRELDKWWPDHPPVTEVTDGEEAAAVTGGGITLTSYGLLPKVPKLEASAIVFDELHYLQGEHAARTLACVRVLRDNPDAWRCGLTGTLIANEPLSIWKPLDVLFPGRFGTRNGFGARYCDADTNSFGNKYFGAREEYAQELASRLAGFSFRATKLDPEIAKLLPPFILQRLDTTRVGRYADAVEACASASTQGARKLVVLTHFKEAARQIGDRLRKLLGPTGRVGVVTGDDHVTKRDGLLEDLRLHPGTTVLVATMHSVGVGIDLTWAEDVTFAELDYSPVQVAQALGRFSRLSGLHGVLVRILVDAGGDRVADSLSAKVQAAGMIISSGQAETHMATATASMEPVLSSDEMNQLLAAMAEMMEE